MSAGRPPLRNRGTGSNPPNRFVPLALDSDPEWMDPGAVDPESVELGGVERGAPSPRTQFLKDTSRTIITYNASPDVGFDASINPYRGCEHGCIYCYARPTHEYLGFSAGLDFETKILVKEDAPRLLERELAASSWRPQVLALSGVTDPYQPIEGRLRLTRRCLEVLAAFRNPVVVVTKNHLVRRDIDLLAELARRNASAVYLSITTLRRELHRVLEPRTCHPEKRLEAIRELSAAGISAGVLVAPVIPGLTDHEVAAIVERAAEAGADRAAYVLLRLPHAVGPLFEEWLENHFPARKARVLERVRATRGGRRSDSRFGSRMRGEGIFAEQIRGLFELARRRAGLDAPVAPLETRHFRNPAGQQLTFFD